MIYCKGMMVYHHRYVYYIAVMGERPSTSAFNYKKKIKSELTKTDIQKLLYGDQ